LLILSFLRQLNDVVEERADQLTEEVIILSAAHLLTTKAFLVCDGK